MTIEPPSDAIPKISVLLPVFNGGPMLLGQAVRSILKQTLQDFELLLIDDGSTDDAVAAIRAIGDARISIIGDTARCGLAARLNQGIAAARGLYIARMDADDISFTARLELQAQFLDANPDIDLVGCRAMVFSGDDVIGLLPFAAAHRDICAQPWRGFPLPHPTWMGRTDWFRRFGYATPEALRCEDQELLLRAYPVSSFACLDEVLLGYRQGCFTLGKTLIARRQLLAAQMRCFAARRQWRLLLLALAAGLIKSMVDVLAALPGCGGLFFTRMAAPVPDNVIRDLKRARLGA